MDDYAIRVEGLGKRYHIGAARLGSDRLTEHLTEAAARPFRRAAGLLRGHAAAVSDLGKPFWALRDVSFEVPRGEVVGIVGSNGAGKSTLLKILSRITAPTEGTARIQGRVGSLLEVGTGFHRDLTGRENVYLNGAILGMSRSEVARKFDEIISFGEVHRFVDTPVKHYSSGMYTRLAFAVAAHLESEILLVDEVLSVGDAAFQKKCFDKIREIVGSGRTVLLVSHNLAAIRRTASRTLLLEGGQLRYDGPTEEAIRSYIGPASRTDAERTWPVPELAPQGDVVLLKAVRIRVDDDVSENVAITSPVHIEMEYDVLDDSYVLLPNFQFFNDEGVHVFSANDLDTVWRGRPRPRGRYTSRVVLPGNFLSEGALIVSAGMETVRPPTFQFYAEDVVTFYVFDARSRFGARGDYEGEMGGVVRPQLDWTTTYEPATEPPDVEEHLVIPPCPQRDPSDKS